MLRVSRREMLAGAGGRVDPQKQIDFPRRFAHLALHLLSQHEERFPGGQGKARDRGPQILPLDLRRVTHEHHDVRLVVRRILGIELLGRAADVLTQLPIERHVSPDGHAAFGRIFEGFEVKERLSSQ